MLKFLAPLVAFLFVLQDTSIDLDRLISARKRDQFGHHYIEVVLDNQMAGNAFGSGNFERKNILYNDVKSRDIDLQKLEQAIQKHK